MPFDHIEDLPVIRRKLLNLEKLRTANKSRFELQADELIARFNRFPG
ncbi:hypothetical protein [Ferrovum sp.]